MLPPRLAALHHPYFNPYYFAIAAIYRLSFHFSIHLVRVWPGKPLLVHGQQFCQKEPLVLIFLLFFSIYAIIMNV